MIKQRGKGIVQNVIEVERDEDTGLHRNNGLSGHDTISLVAIEVSEPL